MPTNIIRTNLSEAVSTDRIFQMIDNYIYLYHTDTVIVVPSYADSVTDTMQANFNSSNLLARSAPIFSYANSGPRTINVKFDLHRDMMKQINYGVSNAPVTLDDDYVDIMIRQIQAIALPEYNTAEKMVNPPMIAVRLGDDIFIKGIVQGGVGVTYQYPILSDGKYALVSIAFSITEVDPYDASTVMKTGSFRGLSASLERKIQKLAVGYTNPQSVSPLANKVFQSGSVIDVNNQNTKGTSYKDLSAPPRPNKSLYDLRHDGSNKTYKSLTEIGHGKSKGGQSR